jgi:hypothetical protein
VTCADVSFGCAACDPLQVGEAERQLKLLFDQAKAQQPAIIFFDEIDGLAPVRSSRQDQIHASVVATLLALMDGLDSRGQIIVIGATNRPDSIDPALRRPGRYARARLFSLFFSESLYFTLHGSARHNHGPLQNRPFPFSIRNLVSFFVLMHSDAYVCMYVRSRNPQTDSIASCFFHYRPCRRGAASWKSTRPSGNHR